MSLVADILFSRPAPHFEGRRRVNMMDARRPSDHKQMNILNRSQYEASNAAVLKSVKLGIGRIRSIAEDAGLSLSTVKRALHDLTDDGLVEYQVMHAGTARYYFYTVTK